MRDLRDPSRRASVEVRQDLLRSFAAPLGTVVVGRRPTAKDDVIVVRMTVPGAIPIDRRMDTYRGFKVDYEVMRVPKVGAW